MRRPVGPQPFAHDPLLRCRSLSAKAAPGLQSSSAGRLERVLGHPATAWAVSSLHPVPGLGHGTRPGREEPWCRETPDGPAAHMWLATATMLEDSEDEAGSRPPTLLPPPASSHRRALLALNRAGARCAKPASSLLDRRAALASTATLPEALRSLTTAAPGAAHALDAEGWPTKAGVVASPKRRSTPAHPSLALCSLHSDPRPNPGPFPYDCPPSSGRMVCAVPTR